MKLFRPFISETDVRMFTLFTLFKGIHLINSFSLRLNMFRLLLSDKILLVQLFYENARSSAVTLRQFRTKRNIKSKEGWNRNTLKSLIDRFEE